MAESITKQDDLKTQQEEEAKKNTAQNSQRNEEPSKGKKRKFGLKAALLAVAMIGALLIAAPLLFPALAAAAIPLTIAGIAATGLGVAGALGEKKLTEVIGITPTEKIVEEHATNIKNIHEKHQTQEEILNMLRAELARVKEHVGLNTPEKPVEEKDVDNSKFDKHIEKLEQKEEQHTRKSALGEEVKEQVRISVVESFKQQQEKEKENPAQQSSERRRSQGKERV